MAQTTFSGPVKSQRGFVTAGPDAVVTAIITPIGMKLEGMPIDDSLHVVSPFATVTVAVY